MKQLSKPPAYFWLGLFIIIGTSLKGIGPAFQNGDYLIYSFSTKCKNCVVTFKAQHGSVISRKRYTCNPGSTPFVKNILRTIARMPAAAERYDEDRAAQDFSGYFHPTRWTSDLLSGAGGVDVPGAPKSRLLVEGTYTNLMEVTNGGVFEFYFIIPVKGVLLVEWGFYGSSLSATSTIAQFSPAFSFTSKRGRFENTTFWDFEALDGSFFYPDEEEVSTCSSKFQQAHITPRASFIFEDTTSYIRIYDSQ